MSEYQFIEFIAVDQPVNDKNLVFMRRQSKRAEITEWRFTNEYHFGDFRGDATEMLRRGYDAHLHYANFGVRKIMFRLPAGLPCDKRTFGKYAIPDYLTWAQDKRGAGGILTIEPEADAGTYEEEADVESLLERLLPLRETLIGGDLRPLFLAWLACCYDEDAEVPPIPAGLRKLTRPLEALAEFYEIPDALVQAAARGSPPAPSVANKSSLIKQWTAGQSKAKLQEIVTELLSSDPATVRSKIMAEIRDAQGTSPWPTVNSTVTYGELRSAAGV